MIRAVQWRKRVSPCLVIVEISGSGNIAKGRQGASPDSIIVEMSGFKGTTSRSRLVALCLPKWAAVLSGLSVLVVLICQKGTVGLRARYRTASEQIDLISLFHRLLLWGAMLHILVAGQESCRRTLARLLEIGCGFRRWQRTKAAEEARVQGHKMVRLLRCLRQGGVSELRYRSEVSRRSAGYMARPVERLISGSLYRRIIVIASRPRACLFALELSLFPLQFSQFGVRIGFVDIFIQCGRWNGTLLKSSWAAMYAIACSPVQVLRTPLTVRGNLLGYMPETRRLLQAVMAVRNTSRGRLSLQWHQWRCDIPRPRRSRAVSGACSMLWKGGDGETDVNQRFHIVTRSPSPRYTRVLPFHLFCLLDLSLLERLQSLLVVA